MQKNIPLPLALLIILVSFIAYYFFMKYFYGADVLERIFFVSADQLYCEVRSGDWTPKSASSASSCNFPPKDAGKACIQASDCNVSCLYSGKANSEGFLEGVCDVVPKGSCVPAIIVKTKNRADLSTLGCNP